MKKQTIMIHALLIFTFLLGQINDTNAQQTKQDLEVLIPLYMYPDVWNGTKDIYQWDWATEAQQKVNISAVINPDDGPQLLVDQYDFDGDKNKTELIANSSYINGIKDLNQNNVLVYAYIKTGWMGNGTDKSHEYYLEDKTNKTAIDDIYNEIIKDLNTYRDYYQIEGAKLDGIFFDETDVSGDTYKLDKYKNLYNAVKGVNSNWKVILNPGTNYNVAKLKPYGDIIVTFENSFKNRTHMGTNSGETDQYAAIVHTTLSGNISDTETVIDDARAKNYDYVYVTNDIYYPPVEKPIGSGTWVVEDYEGNTYSGNNNPFDASPSFWTEMIDYIQEGNLLANANLPKTNTAYFIESKAFPNKVWHIPSTSNNDGDKLFVKNKSGGMNEQFKLTDTGNGTFIIESVKNGKAVDYWHNHVQQWTKHGGLQQQIKIVPAGDGYFRIENQHGRQIGNAVVASADEKLNQTAKSSNQNNQLFRFVEVPAISASDLPKTNTAYFIESKAFPNKVWHFPSESVNNGDKVFVKNKTGSTNEQFKLTDTGNGTFIIESVKNGKAVDYWHNHVQQWTKHGGLQQQVKIVPAGNGYFRIENQHSRQIGNAVVASADEKLDQTAKSANQNNQLFRFVEATVN